MKEKMELLLVEADFYRKNGKFSDALANLHQIIEKYPKELNYQYLLAATYFEAGNIEVAKQYAEQIIEIDPNEKCSLELLGVISVQEERYKEAEVLFKKALEIDPDFHNARQNLIKLHDEHLPDDQAMEEHCKYMIEHRDTARDTYSVKKKNEISWDWLTYVTSRLVKSLAQQHKFAEAIKYLREDMEFFKSTQRKYNPMGVITNYAHLYQLYFRMGNKKELEKYIEEYKEIFPTFTNNEEDFKNYERWALQRYP